VLEQSDLEFHRREFERLTRELEAASEASSLPERATGGEALHSLLLRLRLGRE
jgi:hypothetical protein